MAGKVRWPALAINPSQELESGITSIEGAVNQLGASVTSLQGQVSALQGESESHLIKTGDTMSGTLTFPQGFRIVTFANNPVAGEDVLYIAPVSGVDGVDHVIIGPTGGSQYLKRIRLRADGFQVEGDGQIRLDINSVADGGDIAINDENGNGLLLWDESDNRWEFYKIINWDGIAAGSSRQVVDFGEGYGVYADNTGPGTDNSRLWVDGPDQGAMYFGGRGGTEHLDYVEFRTDEFNFDFGSWTHSLPKGIVYDFGYDSTGAGGTLGVWPVNVTDLSATANVPNGVSCSVFVWGWVRLDNSTDGQFVAFDVTIGGTLVQNPALDEIDQTTGAGGDNVDIDGTSSSEGAHNHNSEVTAFAAHAHTSGSFAVNGTHTHVLGDQWTTLHYSARRSFTPTGSTITIQARGGVQSSGTQVYDDGVIMWMVMVN